MLGLRVETDAAIGQLRPLAHNKSTKFATSLRDRFHTTGVSGAMKHRPNKAASLLSSAAGIGIDQSQQPAVPRNRQLARDQHRVSVEKELEEDERKLRELEEKLAEVRRLKALKQEKKAERKRVRAQNKAAATIQRAWWRYKRQCASKCVDVIKSFLKISANRQAITIGAWAVGVLKRFAIKASYVYLERQRLFAEAMKRVAEEEEEIAARKAALAAAEAAALEEEEARQRMQAEHVKKAAGSGEAKSPKKKPEAKPVKAVNQNAVATDKSKTLQKSGARERPAAPTNVAAPKAEAKKPKPVAPAPASPSKKSDNQKTMESKPEPKSPSKAKSVPVEAKHVPAPKPAPKPTPIAAAPVSPPSASLPKRPPIPTAAPAPPKKAPPPPPKKVIKEAVIAPPPEPREIRSATPRRALDAPKHGVEVKRRLQDEMDEERLRRIAEMHQKRVEQMEVERLRRLKAVEIKKQEIEVKVAKEKSEKEKEEEEKARKREEFMIKLDEAQHQHAREAEMLRMLKEKHQKEREDELMREAAERKEMKKYDNFYNITSKILGGGEMSLQKRLSKPLHLNQPVVEEEPRKRKPRVVQEVMNRSRKNEAGPSQSKGIGRELSSERSNSADPELMNRRAKGATEASDEIGGSSADINHPDATSSSVSKAGVEDDSSLRLSYNSATERHLDAPPEASEAVETPAQIFQAKKMEKLLAAKKALEDEEAQEQARVLEDTRLWAQRRIAEKKKAEKERQQALLYLEEERARAQNANLAAAREVAAKRIADRAREEKERKAKEEEEEELRKKNQQMILEKAQKLLQKSKKREYGMGKLNAKRKKKKNGVSNAMTTILPTEDPFESMEGGNSLELDASDSQLDEAMMTSLDRDSIEENSSILSKIGTNLSESNGGDFVKKLKNVATIMSTINRLAPPSLASFESPVIPGVARSITGSLKGESFSTKPVLNVPTPQPPAPIPVRGIDAPSSLLPKHIVANTASNPLKGKKKNPKAHEAGSVPSEMKAIENLLPPDEKKKSGKVMELLEIVNKARQKLAAAPALVEGTSGDDAKASPIRKEAKLPGANVSNKSKASFVSNMESQFRSAYGKPKPEKAKSKKHKELEAQTNRALSGDLNPFPFLEGAEDKISSGSGHETNHAFASMFSGGTDLELDPFVDIKSVLPNNDGGIGGFSLSNQMGFEAPRVRYQAQYTNEDTADDNPFGFPDSMLKAPKAQNSLMYDPFESDPFSNWENPSSAPSLNNGLPPRPSSKSNAQKPVSQPPSVKAPVALEDDGEDDDEEDEDEDEDEEDEGIAAYESMLDAECDSLRELLEGKFLALSSDFDAAENDGDEEEEEGEEEEQEYEDEA